MPRQSTFKKGQRGASQSPDDMRVTAHDAINQNSSRGPAVAPNEIGGRPDPSFKKKRPQFSQTYWQKSNPHPDYLQGNPDSRREITS